MWSSLLPFFQWCESTWLGTAIRDSRIAFPVIETFHLFALTMLLGSIVVMNLRLAGFMMRRQPVSQVARDLAPWTLSGLLVMLLTGTMLFLSEAMKCYANPSFRVKMMILFPAIIFHYTIYRKMTQPDEVRVLWGRLVAGFSLVLWFGVGLAGRAIGYL